jgi:hypothetical protein
MSQIVSKAAANSAGYLFLKKPSRYIPFSGDFPIVKEYQQSEWDKELYGKMMLEDCSLWFRESVAIAQNMEAIESGFIDYLENSGYLGDFFKLENSKKADLLTRYMDKNCITMAHLNIKSIDNLF